MGHRQSEGVCTHANESLWCGVRRAIAPYFARSEIILHLLRIVGADGLCRDDLFVQWIALQEADIAPEPVQAGDRILGNRRVIKR